MIDLNPLFEFSRTNCVAICAVLVPANLLATSQTLLLLWFRRPLRQVWLMAAIASLCALVMVLHVMTWLIIGVVMMQTFILFGLGAMCLCTNLGAIAYASYRRAKPSGSSFFASKPSPSTRRQHFLSLESD
ncbi:hypothetical protein [Oculatella sp. FACHB-28]|uniref:hypothetical protein n=1 Tax=Oculatella sp. FACHB-28 TaxID=2692845 RepID=UPI0018EFE3E0|nr:hypothetical protein [Oculatella sp. FACHB-28]